MVEYEGMGLLTKSVMIFIIYPFIDGLPFLKMVDLSMAMLNNQMISLGMQTARLGFGG